jgi:hypothetical protein
MLCLILVVNELSSVVQARRAQCCTLQLHRWPPQPPPKHFTMDLDTEECQNKLKGTFGEHSKVKRQMTISCRGNNKNILECSHRPSLVRSIDSNGNFVLVSMTQAPATHPIITRDGDFRRKSPYFCLFPVKCFLRDSSEPQDAPAIKQIEHVLEDCIESSAEDFSYCAPPSDSLSSASSPESNPQAPGHEWQGPEKDGHNTEHAFDAPYRTCASWLMMPVQVVEAWLYDDSSAVSSSTEEHKEETEDEYQEEAVDETGPRRSIGSDGHFIRSIGSDGNFIRAGSLPASRPTITRDGDLCAGWQIYFPVEHRDCGCDSSSAGSTCSIHQGHDKRGHASRNSCCGINGIAGTKEESVVSRISQIHL